MSNNPLNLFIGTGTFRFHATLPALDPDLAASYTTTFGNHKKVSLRPGGDVKEHFGSYAGKLKLDRKITTKQRLTYEIMLDEISPAVLALIMGSATGEAPDPLKTVEGFGWLGLDGHDEPVIPAEDKAVFVHHSFKCGISFPDGFDADGENFSETKLLVDVYLGTPGLWFGTTRPIAAA